MLFTWRCLPPYKCENFAHVGAAVYSQNALNSSCFLLSVCILTVSTHFWCFSTFRTKNIHIYLVCYCQSTLASVQWWPWKTISFELSRHPANLCLPSSNPNNGLHGTISQQSLGQFCNNVVSLPTISTPPVSVSEPPAKAGLPPWLIKVLGRWSSDCYELPLLRTACYELPLVVNVSVGLSTMHEDHFTTFSHSHRHSNFS